MKLLFAFLAVATYGKKIPAFPVVDFTSVAAVDVSPFIVTSLLDGVVSPQRVDLPDTEPGEALTRGNIIIETTVTIVDGTDVCSSAEFISAPGIDGSNDLIGSIQITTKDTDGECFISISATDSFRQTTTANITVLVVPVEGDNDCIFSQDLTAPSDCDINGERVQFRVVIKEATGNGVCDPPKTVISPPESLCPTVDCELTDPPVFSEFSACDCGGTRTKTRTQLEAIPQGFQGEACPVVTETVPCGSECPIDCAFTEFGDFTECTAACGGGERFRFRTVAQEAVNGGADCVGEVFEREACNEDPCPVDCEIGYTDFSPCTATCGGGTQTRQMVILTEPENGGEECPELVPETQACNTEECSIETCNNRCGFIGRLRGGVREGEDEDQDQQEEDDQGDIEESKQFGGLFFFFNNRARRPRLPRRRDRQQEIPNCSCDALCARALRSGDNCCSDILTYCPNIRILPRREPLRARFAAGDSDSNPNPRCPGSVFRSGPSFNCPEIPVGTRGFFVGCTACADL
jgi:hypothetical protein